MHSRRLHPGAKPCAAVAGTLLLSVLWHVPAVAQSSSPRVSVAVNSGRQAASAGLTDEVVFTEFAEEGSLNAQYPAADGPLFDVNVRVRVAGQFAIGGGVSLVPLQMPADVHARLPHPLYFRSHRVVNAASPNLQRRETTVNVHAAWVMPVTPSVDVTVFAGPTMAALTQELVNGVEYSHAYPYTSVSVTGADYAPRSGSSIGFLVGADVAYYVSGSFGLGGTVQFNRASLMLDSAGGGTLEVDSGGLQATGGIRLRF